VGVLDALSPSETETNIAALEAGLAEAGYAAGKNLKIEFAWAYSQLEKLPDLVRGLVASKPDLLVCTGGTTPVLAAKAATRSIPIVSEFGLDPVQAGLVAALARPGTNVTGVWVYSQALTQKRVDILRTLLPAAKALGHMSNPTAPGFANEQKEVALAAAKTGFTVVHVEASSLDELDRAFETLTNRRADAMLVSSFPFFVSAPIRERIIGLSSQHSLPASFVDVASVAAGGLIGYGADQAAAARSLGLLAGRVLAGARPADLPVQIATKYELAINLKTAKSMGVAVPSGLLASADQVIE